MHRLKIYFIWCCLAAAFIACDKKENASPTANQDYIPTTAGSTWSYGGSMPYILSATGQTKEINGKTYFELETKQGTNISKSYINHEKSVYTAVGLVPNLGDVEVMLLKEETPVGKPWEQTTNFNGVDTKLTFTILEKDVSKVVEGKTYQKVIHVKMTVNYTFMGVDLGSNLASELYFAKGVGLILSDLGTYGQSALLNYDVK
ncbi:hypothetical protein HUW51_15130 [Adhaeribacter swui]|uniref:Uncharacterized protein n=1 Tax=Adhaeribacter swui TaxID=2086471 RepID=A0A7G7GA04_9BACT|nr:hypothetical protein [Adhaeribacter swui]QNF33988.1 hypothetical protein HUW51_15130 [Adhaeribacter swui]